MSWCRLLKLASHFTYQDKPCSSRVLAGTFWAKCQPPSGEDKCLRSHWWGDNLPDQDASFAFAGKKEAQNSVLRELVSRSQSFGSDTRSRSFDRILRTRSWRLPYFGHHTDFQTDSCRIRNWSPGFGVVIKQSDSWKLLGRKSACRQKWCRLEACPPRWLVSHLFRLFHEHEATSNLCWPW